MKKEIDSLLSLQEKDALYASLKDKLAKFPVSLEAIDSRIDAVEKRYTTALEQLSALEAKRADMRLERRALEEKISKYKIHLTEVKKNDEYTAVNAEIDRLSSEAGKMEEIELQVMFDIDNQRTALAPVRTQCDNEISELKKQKLELQSQGASLEKQCSDSRRELDSAFALMSPKASEIYRKIRAMGKRLPIVVEVKADGLCGGCHLKVSTEIISQLSQKNFPVICENCGRILWNKDSVS